jgi:hypothetical protein
MTSNDADDTSGLKDFKITKRSQKSEATKEINDNTVSLTFSSPFAKTNASSRASSRQASRPTSKRSSKRISGFDLLEKSISGMFQQSPSKRDNHNVSENLEKSLQSPMKLNPKSNEEDKADNNTVDGSSDDSFGWQDVDAVADRNVYDENGKLQLYSFENSNDMKAHNRKEIFGSMNGNEFNHDRKPSVDDASDNEEQDAEESDKKDFFNKNNFAYTKIDDEEQAKASRKTNVKVDNIIASATLYQRSHPNSQEQVDKDMNDDELSDDEADITHEDLTRNNQLNGMKHLLTDNEKFAYAGCVFLLLNELCAQLATRNLSSNMIKDQKLAKRLHNVQKDYGYWKEEIMNKIYFHMEFNEEEVEMIEKLGLYPLEIEDLMQALKIQRKVFNPYNPEVQEQIQDKEKDQSTSEYDENDIKVSSMKTITDNDILEQVPENVVSVDSIIHERELEVDVPWSVICDLFLLFLSKGTYDARSRVVLKKFAEHLSITIEEVNQFERRITETLELEQTDEQNLTRDDLLKKRRQRRSKKKMAYVGLATVGGSLVLGLSGGLLAPVIGAGVAAGLSTVGITGLSGFLTGVGGTATVAATSTAIGANIGGSSMSRRMGSVRTFEFKPLHNNRRLNLIISISGWMTGDEDDVRLPFSTVDPVEGDLFSLHWEPDILKSTGDTMSILASEAITQTIQQVLGATILTAFMGAIQLPMALSKLGYLIDNPWNVSLDRAWNSGILLAQYLMERNLGSRPVTLVGFSLGSRVIYYCLKELAKKGCTGIIENVIILGAPVVYNKDELVMCRSVVAGRFVNGYSEKDWILGYLFRATAGGISTVAGLSPIENEGIENFDCSDIVNGHMGYRKNIPKIMKMLGFSILSEDFVEIDDTPNPDREKKQKELLDTLKKLEDDEKKKPLKKSSSWLPSWLKPKKEEWQEMVKKDVVESENTKKKSQDVPEYKPEVPEEGSKESTLQKTYISVPRLQNDSETPSSPVTQEGETFSLKLNHSRPRFASGNIGFVLKNAGKSRTPSGLSTASKEDKIEDLGVDQDKTDEVKEKVEENEIEAHENEDTNSVHTVEKKNLPSRTDDNVIDETEKEKEVKEEEDVESKEIEESGVRSEKVADTVVDQEPSQENDKDETDLKNQSLTPPLQQTPNFNPIPPAVFGSASRMSGLSAESPFYTADDGNDLEDNYDDNDGNDVKIPNIIEDPESQEDEFHFEKPTVMSHDPSMSSNTEEMESECNSVKTALSNATSNVEGQGKKSMESTISTKGSPRKKGKGKKKKNKKK